MMPVLIEAALRALLVALTVWAGLHLFRVTNVLAQKAAWSLVLAAAVAMPTVMHWQLLPASFSVLLPMPAPHGQEALPAQMVSRFPTSALSATESQRINPAPNASLAAGNRFPAPVISQSQFNATPAVRDRTESAVAAATRRPLANRVIDSVAGLRRLSVYAIAAGVYFAVLACLLMRLMYGLVMAAGMWFAAEPLAADSWPEIEAATALRLRLRSSRNISSPVTIGSGVVLPASWIDWDAEKLRIVLAHEQSHVRQGDFYLQMLVSIYAAVFWFSPLGWWLKRKLCDLGEAISDRAGLEEAASRTAYAQVLLEFAALPRPTALGVAMARTGNLSHRIERLLNEARFRQAFAGSRRILLAILLVPVALFAATALVRVEAASSGQAAPLPPAPATAPDPALAPTPATAPSPDAQVPASPTPTAVAPTAPALAAPAPLGPSTEGSAMAPVAPVAAGSTIILSDGLALVAPVSPRYREIRDSADEQAEVIADGQSDSTSESTRVYSKSKHLVSTSKGRGYSYSYSSDGDSYALITDASDRVTFSGDWNDSTRNTIDKVRKLTNGKFLWFSHNGKSYFIDDQAQVSQIEAMYKPMQDLGHQQEELGKKQEALGRQQEELGKKQEQASIPTPDISKEMAKLNEAVAKLNAKKGSTVSQDELADIEGRLGDIQGRLGELQGEIGAKQGQFGEAQGRLGDQQGQLGEEQGRLGAEEGKLAEQADRKIKSIIDESLRNGKARPVE